MQHFGVCKKRAFGIPMPLSGLLNKYRQAVKIMKITAFILLVCTLHVSAGGFSQSITLSVKEASLTKIFKAIEKQTDYIFFYNVDWVKKIDKVNVDVKDMQLQQVLELLFRNLPITYSITGKMITVIPKKDEKTTLNGSGLMPPIDISGKILDENGAPLPGANVVEKGTQHGTTTNADGVFVLKGVDENGSLVISYVGFQTLTIPVNSRSSIVVSIKQSDANLQEVVINKGYYTELKKFSTGNVSTITSKDIEKQPIQNPLLALQGRVPGVEVYQTTGINRGGVTVRIQGINNFGSLNASGQPKVGTEPLIIIDGVPYPSQTLNGNLEYVTAGGSPLNYFNPSDIESISVLKDADATAIYGSRAANGAILITTKKGKAGKPKLSVDVQQGWGKVTRHVDMMNTRQYLDMRYEAYKNDGIDLTTQGVGSRNYDLKLWDTTRYTDWQKELIGGTAQYTNINASVSGGTDQIQYLLGANYNRQTTVFPGNFADKTGGFHFSLNGSSPDQRLRIQLSGSYNYNENGLPGVDLTKSAILLEPDAPKLYNDDGSLNWAPNASGSSSFLNPLAKSVYSEYSNTAKNLVTNLNVSYSISRGLVLSSNFGYNNLQSNAFNGAKLEYTRPESRPFSTRSANFGTSNTTTWIIEPQLRFEKNISKGKLEALIGSTIQKSSGNYLQINASGQPTNELLHSLGAATSTFAFGSDYTRRFNGVFGRIGYNWDKKYLLNLTGRRDGSSKFGAENRFHNFWSAGVGWIVSEEKFLQSSKSWLSFGKIRASYGTTGNDQIADYSYLSLYDIVSTDILYQGTTSFNVTGFSNPFLQWEETRKLQGGIDLSALNERIALSFTYARNRSSNQLIAYSLPDLTGFSSFTKNFPATVQNTSLEFSLNTVNVKSKDFNWSTNINLTIPRNKVTSFPGIELTSYATGDNGLIIGEPVGIQKKNLYGGVDPATGGYLLIDSTGKIVDPTVSSSALKQSAMVSLLPKFYGGISNTISYKGFQLDFLFQFVYQVGSKDMYYSNTNVPPGVFNRGLSNQPVTALNHWQKPGDDATLGRYTTNTSFTIWPYYYSNEGYSYAAGSYIRLKNASLSWQFPNTWSKKAHLQSARLYFRGQNLATITGYKGLDPETKSISTLPPLQMWTVGVKIEL
jgi:TonB-linked SusC/RagA family outer membrane protein